MTARGQVKSGQKAGSYLDAYRVFAVGQRSPGPDSLRQQCAVADICIDETYGGFGVRPRGQGGRLSRDSSV